MSKLSDDQIKALWREVASRADFSRGPTWKYPVYRRIRDGYEHARDRDPTVLPPPEEMYVEFRMVPGAYGAPGSMGHRVTRIIGNGVVVDEVHHHEKPIFIPFESDHDR